MTGIFQRPRTPAESKPFRLWPVVGFLLLLTAMVRADDLPSPDGLRPEIEFWHRVFVETTTDQALVHDNRHLDIVYEVVDIAAELGPSRRRRLHDAIRREYRETLTQIANGRRDHLTPEQRRVLALWPKDVSNDELRAAAKRVRIQQGLADRFQAGLVRSGQWQDHIRHSLRQQGVPEGLAALPHVESSFNPGARSHVGAAGLWQFTRSTGKRYMQIDHVVDERLDPYLSSEAAARLLAYNHSILESWPLAITAYNHGVAGMRRAVKSLGTDDIETIVRNYSGRSFGFASRNFYVAFLAARDAEQNAETYFGPIHRAAPREELVMVLPDYVPIAALETVIGVSRDTLRAYNPALMASVWDGTKYVPKGYPLRIPRANDASGVEDLMGRVPSSQRYAAQTPDMYHKVERGDSLSVIAARYHTSVSQLVELNGLRSRHRIRVGQVLRLPYSGPLPGAPIPDDADTYVVRTGDTLGVIAARAGLSETELLALNTISNRNRIYPGQTLVLKTGEPAAKAVAQAPAPQPVEPEPAPGAAMSAGPEPAAAEPAVEPEQAPVVENEPAIEPEQAPVVGDGPDGGGQLLADPSDYLVADDDSIEVQAAETLGHYADWLGLPTQRLRDINGYSFRRPVVIGSRLKLDFRKVSPGTFVARRVAYHRELQESFFSRYRITDETVHRLRRGESIWVLTQRRYKVPVWLLRQYNPELDFDHVRPGTRIVFPRISPVKASGKEPNTMASAS